MPGDQPKKHVSRKDALGDEFVTRVLGEFQERFTGPELGEILRRASEFAPRFLHGHVTDQAVRRAMTVFLSALEGRIRTARGAFQWDTDESSKDLRVRIGRELDSIQDKLMGITHSAFRGLQDAFVGILSGELRRQEADLNRRFLGLMSNDHGNDEADKAGEG